MMNGEGLRGTIALVSLGIALAAGAVVFLASRASEPGGTTTALPTREAKHSKEAAEPAAAREPQLHLAAQGHPVLTVRDGQRVDIHSAPGGPVVRTVGDETEFGSTRRFSVARVEGEWVGVPNQFTGNDALGWIRLDPDRLLSGYTRESMVIDLSEYRAQLYRGDQAIRSFTVAIGAPGTETPTGQFAVSDTFRGNLNPAYGCCAVALTAEQSKLGAASLIGDRIAIHGTSGPLGVAISHGCVRAADRDVSALVDKLPPGAPVTIQA